MTPQYQCQSYYDEQNTLRDCTCGKCGTKVKEGQKCGRWTVIDFSHFDKAGRGYWNCECTCGTKNAVLEYNLKIGQSKSCGCLAGELTAKRHIIHGMEKTRQYRIWRHMINRCCRPSARGYHNYGGRGIKVCDKWKTFIGFWEDMKEGYSDELSIDRIDSNGDYYKENCRWATMKEQQRNRRNNVMYNGEYATDATKRLGGKSSLIAQRLRYGWSLEKAFTTPIITRYEEELKVLESK